MMNEVKWNISKLVFILWNVNYKMILYILWCKNAFICLKKIFLNFQPSCQASSSIEAMILLSMSITYVQSNFVLDGTNLGTKYTGFAVLAELVLEPTCDLRMMKLAFPTMTYWFSNYTSFFRLFMNVMNKYIRLFRNV